MPNRRSDVDKELDPEVVKFLQGVRVCCQMWSLYDALELSFDPCANAE